jgi:hypothetical protein
VSIAPLNNRTSALKSVVLRGKATVVFFKAQ